VIKKENGRSDGEGKAGRDSEGPGKRKEIGKYKERARAGG